MSYLDEFFPMQTKPKHYSDQVNNGTSFMLELVEICS